MIRILDFKSAQAILGRKQKRLDEAVAIVAPILEAVRTRGDAAVLEYARRFDGFAGSDLRVPVRGKLSQALRDAVKIAATNIRDCALAQLPRESSNDSGDGRILSTI